MAIVGDKLATPETGWRRYDDAHPLIRYIDFPFVGGVVAGAYNNTTSFNAVNSTLGEVRFRFKGTKVRIITPSGSPSYRAKSVDIYIDGVKGNFSMNNTNNFMNLTYEKTGLTNGIHEVVINNFVVGNTSYSPFGLDAIDIDDNGELMTPEPLYKVLIFNDNQYKKYSTSSWQTVSLITPTELDYTQGNTLEEIALISELAWKQLSGDIEFNIYTDGVNIKEVQFNIETTPFTLADEFKGKEVKILEYTDNPSQVESKVETEVEPYSIYDEFGDTMEVLYYTDDTAKTKADLEITANYSPLDELTGDFEVVTWSNAIDEVVQEAIPQLTSDVVAEGTVYETPLNLENVVKVS